MDQAQKELLEIDMPLENTVPVTNSASVSDTPGANALPLNSSVHFSSTFSYPRADTLATTNKDILEVPPFDRVTPDSDSSLNHLEIIQSLSQDWENCKTAPR